MVQSGVMKRKRKLKFDLQYFLCSSKNGSGKKCYTILAVSVTDRNLL
jgi:hypothetical protein